MIRVHCRTNLDKYRNKRWPEEFVVPPQIGDFVESDSNDVLQIKEIIHKMSHSWSGANRSVKKCGPILEIYLGEIH